MKYQENTKQSSRVFNKLFERNIPAHKLLIDNIAFTVPISTEQLKSVPFCLEYIKNKCNLAISIKQLDKREALEQKYMQRITIRDSEDAAFNMFFYGLNDKQNQMKVSFNPSKFCNQTAQEVFCILRELVFKDEYKSTFSNSKITSMHFAFDIANIPIEHLPILYSYRSPYEAFADENSFSGFRFGKKRGCPVIAYDKLKESDYTIKSFESLTRIEKQDRPQQRYKKSKPALRLGNIQIKSYCFQGLTFIDPIIFKKMPEEVYELITKHGLAKAKDLASEKYKNILTKKIEKHSRKLRKDQRENIKRVYREKLQNISDFICNS